MKSVLKPTTSFLYVHMYVASVSIWQHTCSCGFIMMSDKRSDPTLSSTTTQPEATVTQHVHRVSYCRHAADFHTYTVKMPEGSQCESASASSNCWKDPVSAITAQICSKTMHTQVLTYIVVMVVMQPLAAVSDGSYGDKPLADR